MGLYNFSYGTGRGDFVFKEIGGYDNWKCSPPEYDEPDTEECECYCHDPNDYTILIEGVPFYGADGRFYRADWACPEGCRVEEQWDGCEGGCWGGTVYPEFDDRTDDDRDDRDWWDD